MVRVLGLVFVVLLVGGCNRQSMFDKFASPEEQSQARAYLDQIHAHDFAAIKRDIDPSLQISDLDDLLNKMAALPPAGEPTSVKVVGAQSFNSPNEKKVNVTFEYEFSGKWFIENLATLEKNGTKTVIGFHVIPESKSMEEQNKFTLSGKSTVQYAVLGGAIGALAVTLYALVECIRTKRLRRKWLWILFVLVGFGSVSVNWTTGEIGYHILQIKLLSAGAAAQFYEPWIVSVGLPLGAIVFLLRKRFGRLKINEPEAPPT